MHYLNLHNILMRLFGAAVVQVLGKREICEVF
jgi:hypothetical protein